MQAESFICAGPRMFNCLPMDITDLTGASTETVKKRLDTFLAKVPDEPPAPHGPPSRRAAANAITDQLQYVKVKVEQRCGGGGPRDRPW